MNGEAKTYVKLFDFKIYNDNPFTEESDSEDIKKKRMTRKQSYKCLV